MKKLITTAILAAIVAAGSTIMAQDQPEGYLGLPGDNLNLYATMKLFQESETLEGFERSLNDENSRINNLDLNGDNQIDYIRVTDYVDGDVHNIVLQAVLGRNESQDVAVFTVQRFSDGSVQIQLTGDDALYGKNYIIEPIYDETPNPGYVARAGNPVTVVRTTTIQVAAWPIVRYMYLPGYVVWRSSWYWDYYPVYWHPWRPFWWHYYYGYHSHWYPEYYGRYHRWEHHRYANWDNFYYSGRRVYSPEVHTRINSGYYRTTYSHPDERKRGEDLYYTTYKERGNRQSVTSTGGNNRRVNYNNSSVRTNTSGNNGSNRRINSNSTTRTNVPSAGTSRNTGRRVSNDNMNNKYGDKNQPGGNATNWKNRSNGNADNPVRSNGNVSNPRRNSTSVSTGHQPQPNTGRKIETGNSKRESPANVSSSGRRASGTTGTIRTKSNSGSPAGVSSSGRRNSGNSGSVRTSSNSKNNSSGKSNDKRETSKNDNSSRRK